MKVEIRYLVPLRVGVDTVTCEVEYASIANETPELYRDSSTLDGSLITYQYIDGEEFRDGQVADRDVRRRALEIAAIANWPEWHFGA